MNVNIFLVYINMQNPYAIDIQQEIIQPELEHKITYKLNQYMNKKSEITENSYQSIQFTNKKPTLKRKYSDISEETLQNMVYTKLKISK